MTPRKKAFINISAVLSAVIAVAGFAVKSSASAIDSRYVHVDTFAIVQAGQSLQHRTDSLVHDKEIARIDVMLSGLYRACQRRKECP